MYIQTNMSSVYVVLPKDALEGKLLIGLQHVLFLYYFYFIIK